MNLLNIPNDIKNKICDFQRVKDIANYSCVDKDIRVADHKYKMAYKTMKKYMRNAKQNKLLRFKTFKEIMEYIVLSPMRRNASLPAYNIGTYLEDFSLEKTVLPSQLVELEHRYIPSRSTNKFVVQCARHGDILKHFIVSGKNIRRIELRFANFYPDEHKCMVWASKYNNASLIHLQPFYSGLIVIGAFYDFYLDIDADEINFVKAKYLYLDHPERSILAHMPQDKKIYLPYFSPEKIKNYLPSKHPEANIVCHRHVWSYEINNKISCFDLAKVSFITS